MTKSEVIDERPIIEYPCNWQYKLIGKNETKVKEVIDELLSHKSIILSKSKVSKKKKYTSFNLEVNVENEEERDRIFQSLKVHNEIVMVL